MLRWFVCFCVGLAVGFFAPNMSKADASSRAHIGSTTRNKHVSRSKHKSSRRKKKGKRLRPPEMPKAIELTSYDVVTGQGGLIVVGTKRLPEMRLLVLTDDRKRRFVPDMAECEPPAGAVLDGSDPALIPENLRWRCTFSVPPLFRRAALVGVAMEWGDKFVEAPAKRVAKVYAAAAKQLPEAPLPQSEPEPLQRPTLELGNDTGGSSEGEILDEEVGDTEDR